MAGCIPGQIHTLDAAADSPVETPAIADRIREPSTSAGGDRVLVGTCHIGRGP
jgi:hypothetical protein